MAHFLVQQLVHQVAQHHGPRGFFGLKSFLQGPFRQGLLPVHAVGNGGDVDEVIGLQNKPLAGNQGRAARRARRGLDHGGAQQQGTAAQGAGRGQHPGVGLGHPHPKRLARGPARAGRFRFGQQFLRFRVAGQQVHPPAALGRGRVNGCVGEWANAFRNIVRRWQARASVGPGAQARQQLNYGVEALRRFGRRGGVALVQHQVGHAAQRVQAAGEAGGQLPLVGQQAQALAEVGRAAAQGLVLGAHHGQQQVPQPGQVVGGRRGGVGGQGGELGVEVSHGKSAANA